MSNNLFSHSKPIIGVIHVGALPGTPAAAESVSELITRAAREAAIYRDGGLDAIMIENMHDVPYLRSSVGPEIVAAMTLIGQAVKIESKLPVGIQILAGANIEAMAAAHAAELDFIRAEGYVFAHVADEGWIESSAANLLRYRKLIGADRIRVWTDVKKKHSAHAITSDVTIGEMAETVEFMRGDVVIITGSATGKAPDIEDVKEARSHCRLPIVLGSGIDADNLSSFYESADGFIIGSYFKIDGHWANTVDPQRIDKLIQAAQKLGK